jgi:hypothetical protein
VELHNGLEGTVVFDGRPEKIQAAKLRLVGRHPFCQFSSVMLGVFFEISEKHAFWGNPPSISICNS